MGQHQAAARKIRLTLNQNSKLTESLIFLKKRKNKLFVMILKVSEA